MISKVMRTVLSFLIVTGTLAPTLSLFAAASQDHSNEAIIKQLFDRLFTAQRKKDLAQVMACWSPESIQIAYFEQKFKEDFAGWSEVQFTNIIFLRSEIEDNQAYVRLRYERSGRDAQTEWPDRQTIVVDVSLVKQTNGWKILELTSPGSDLGRKLIATRTPEGRKKLIESDKELLMPELVLGFCDAAMRRLDQGKLDEALRVSDISLEVAELLGDGWWSGRSHLVRGIIDSKLKKYPDAEENLREALRVFHDIKDEYWEAWALDALGELSKLTIKFKEALAMFARSQKQMGAIRNRPGEIATTLHLGMVLRVAAQYQEALIQLEAGEKLCPSSDYKCRFDFMIEKGLVYYDKGKYVEALTLFESILRIIPPGKEEEEARARVLTDIGSVCEALGDYGAALNRQEEVLEIMRELHNQEGEATALHNLGVIYSRTGNFPEAFRKYEASQKINHVIDNPSGEAMTANSLGNLYQYLGSYPEALKQYETSVTLKRALHDRAGEAKTLNNLGIVYGLMGRPADALTQYELALKISTEIGAKAQQAVASINIGAAYFSEEEFARGQAYSESGLTTLDEIGDRLGAANAYANIGAAAQFQRQWRKAAEAYRKAISLIEAIRTETIEPSLQTSFFGKETAAYYGLIGSLLELHSEPDEILSIAERLKARTLVELMVAGKVNVTKSMTAAEQQREQELLAGMSAATAQGEVARLAVPFDERLHDDSKRAVELARADYDEFRRKLFIAHRELQAQRAAIPPLTLVELSKLLFTKNPDLCVLSYLVSDENTFLLVITGDPASKSGARLNVYVLKAESGEALSAAKLKDLLVAFRLRLTNAEGVYKEMARALYKVLLAPAEQLLAGKNQVLIIPDSMLNTLPFQALIDRDDKHFFESHTISYAPSVTALAQMMDLADHKNNINAGRSLLAIGRRAFPDQAAYRDRELPLAEEQVKSIADLFHTTAFVGSAATKANAILNMSNARYVHFATHGEVNDVAPMYSAIVLGKSGNDDGMLHARDFFDLKVKAELVVLAACETGLGQMAEGEGIVGLSWALFVAGTPSSMVTQWKVRDDSMNILMLEFYRQLRVSGTNGKRTISKAEALRKAQLSVMKQNGYQHPYYWAPVVLIGDWR
jgi:CHAT domain-containing protein/Tfp pilus assembly protein PilF